MASRFDDLVAIEHARVFTEMMETVTRRPSGVAANDVEVDNVIVQLDSQAAGIVASRGGLIDNERALMQEEGALLIVPVSTSVTPHDHWIVRGRLYVSLGGPVLTDEATKTLVIVRKNYQRGREPRTTSHAR
jgi:hypothetical protein